MGHLNFRCLSLKIHSTCDSEKSHLKKSRKCRIDQGSLLQCNCSVSSLWRDYFALRGRFSPRKAQEALAVTKCHEFKGRLCSQGPFDSQELTAVVVGGSEFGWLFCNDPNSCKQTHTHNLPQWNILQLKFRGDHEENR